MPNILVVDDDASIRNLFYSFFSDTDTVETAANGQKALDKLESFRPDIMLLDMSMPVMTGPQLVANLDRLSVENEHLRDIPFIVLTGENPQENLDCETLRTHPNCKGFFQKGLPLTTVASQINMALAQY